VNLGRWVAAYLAVHPPAAARPQHRWRGAQITARLKSLLNEAASDPSWKRIKARLEFLMCDKSKVLDDPIETRRAIYV
jgi:2-hydroxy-6-oxonona-2,4-dienedioate hydrolase